MRYNEGNGLIDRLKLCYSDVKYINLSLGAIGVYCKSEYNLLDMFADLQVDKVQSDYVLTKISNVCIRSTYYLFCLRDKVWTEPQLMAW